MFKVGDRVRVITRRHGNRQCGNIGTIDRVDEPMHRHHLNLRVRFDPGMYERSNTYAASDLELLTRSPRSPFEAKLYAYIERELRPASGA